MIHAGHLGRGRDHQQRTAHHPAKTIALHRSLLGFEN
jgi:hypothetical protein